MSNDREARTLTYGREILARLAQDRPVPFSPAWLDDRLMAWTMGDEAVKVQLFRFVDALPLLHSPAEISRHLREYLGEAGDRLPGWLQLGLRWLPTAGLPARLLARAALA